MTPWKKLYTKHLINTAMAVNSNLTRNNVYPIIKIPTSLNTEDEIHSFSKEVIFKIRCPSIRYFNNNYK